MLEAPRLPPKTSNVLRQSVITALVALLFLALTAAGRRRPPRFPAFRAVAAAFVAGALVGLAALAYAYFVEPYWLEPTTVEIHAGRWRGASRPLRLVQISDLHCEEGAGPDIHVPDMVAAMKPDVIVFTGDCANSPPGVHLFKTIMRRVSRLAPTFAVTGAPSRNPQTSPVRGAPKPISAWPLTVIIALVSFVLSRSSWRTPKPKKRHIPAAPAEKVALQLSQWV